MKGRSTPRNSSDKGLSTAGLVANSVSSKSSKFDVSSRPLTTGMNGGRTVKYTIVIIIAKHVNRTAFVSMFNYFTLILAVTQFEQGINTLNDSS